MRTPDPSIMRIMAAGTERKHEVIAIMAAVIGSADSICHINHDPKDLVDKALEIYDYAKETVT